MNINFSDSRIKIFFIGAVILQFAVLGSIAGQREYLLKTGERMILQCEPVDPRSLMSGDYVILNYAISRFTGVQFARLAGDVTRFKKNDKIYVALEPDDDGVIRRAVAVGLTLEEAGGSGRKIIRGTIVHDSYRWEIKYGIESYFVPQFQGLAIERQIKNVTVEVAVSKQGEAALRKLRINGSDVTFY